MLLCRLAAMIALGFCLTALAAPNRLRVYPNSLTIFSIAEGPDGLLWLAAEDGLYQFDGFHYHKITAYPFASARFVAFTTDGSLWAADFEGLARGRNNRFEVNLHEDVSGLAAYRDQVFARLTHGLAQIGLDGSVQHLKLPARRDLSVDSHGKLWFACQLTAGCSYDPAHPDQSQIIQFPPASLYAQVVRDSLGRLWAADPERALLIENGRATLTLERQRTIKADRPGPLFSGRNGQLWFLGETIRGLIPKVEFRDREDHDRYSPTSGIEDSRGHVWVASFGQGLVEWTPDPEWQRWFPEDFNNETPVQLTSDASGSIIAATQKNIFRLDRGTESWLKITKQPYRYYALLPLENGEFLASIRDFGVARISADGRVVEHVADLLPQEPDQYREILRDAKGRIWVGTKRVLIRVEGSPGSFRLHSESLPDLSPRYDSDPVALELDRSKHLWVGYSKGLAWLDDQDHWHKIETDQPITLVRDFALAGDDIWVAHRRNGAFSRLHRNGDRWNVTLFTPGNGYAPAATEFLKRDSRGWIWRGTDEGVYVSDGTHIAPNDWLHIDMQNGLAANEMGQYGFFEDPQGTVWITGDEGVTSIHPGSDWFGGSRWAPPRVTRIEADGRVFLYPEGLPTSLPTPTKVLRADVGSLNAPPFRTYPLRYRLRQQSKGWQLSRDGSLEFHDLPDGDYSLEIGFTGTEPSPVATYNIRVGAGTTTFSRGWMIAILLVAGGVVLIVRYAPGFERARFRIEKAVFLMRRRMSRQRQPNPAVQSLAPDHSGETLLNRYQLNRIVSRGGFSVVYEARDVRDGVVRLAVKILNGHSTPEGWVRDRFAHEVAALRSIDHPGVVRILDSWISAAGEPCLAMPYLEGVTLRSALDGPPLKSALVARIVRQLGSALAEVHGRGIVHRDLKPENMILVERQTGAEQVVIIDFGTAGLRTAENELAATTLMSGSFHYMAPERLVGRYSAASDAFSLAVIILEILAGKRLANLKATYGEASFLAELEKVLSASLEPEAARKVAELLAQAYNPDPRARPSEIADWTERIASAIDAN